MSTEEATPGGSWHLFNDFLVRPISEDEALSFPGSWKVSPESLHRDSEAYSFCQDSRGALLRACRRSRASRLLAATTLGRPFNLVGGHHRLSVSSHAPVPVLVADLRFHYRNRDPALVKHQPLRADELPRKGTLISIDAEFVSLQQVRADSF